MNFFHSRNIRVIIIFCVAILFVYVCFLNVSVPKKFVRNSTFIVNEDESLKSISSRLRDENYISSALLFRLMVSFIGQDRHIQLGEYFFDKPLTLNLVVKKLISQPDVPLIKITLPEGSTTSEIATIIKKSLPDFSTVAFGEKVFTNNAEGKLFPSTYFLLPSSSEQRIVEIMLSTFEKKYNENFKNEKIPALLENLNEVVILASILEGEVKTEKDMRIVAGVLLSRLKYQVALQVDAAPETYKKRGLPVGPINNPGLKAISAVFNPEETDYFYYISDKNGTIHYAKTFPEHKENIRKYLK